MLRSSPCTVTVQAGSRSTPGTSPASRRSACCFRSARHADAPPPVQCIDGGTGPGGGFGSTETTLARSAPDGSSRAESHPVASTSPGPTPRSCAALTIQANRDAGSSPGSVTATSTRCSRRRPRTVSTWPRRTASLPKPSAGATSKIASKRVVVSHGGRRRRLALSGAGPSIVMSSRRSRTTTSAPLVASPSGASCRSTPTTSPNPPAWPARTPATESSTTIASAASTPRRSAALRRVSGAGLPARPQPRCRIVGHPNREVVEQAGPRQEGVTALVGADQGEVLAGVYEHLDERHRVGEDLDAVLGHRLREVGVLPVAESPARLRLGRVVRSSGGRSRPRDARNAATASHPARPSTYRKSVSTSNGSNGCPSSRGRAAANSSNTRSHAAACSAAVGAITPSKSNNMAS